MAAGPTNDTPFRLIHDVEFGNDVVVHSFTNLYGCRIGDGTRIGPFVEIQAGAQVGARCKIQSHSFICDGVVIEDEVFVGHGVMFVNDKHPKATNERGELRRPRRLATRQNDGPAGRDDRLKRDDRRRGHDRRGRRRRRRCGRHARRGARRDGCRRARPAPAVACSGDALRVLVLGAAGMLGHKVLQTLSIEVDAYGTVRGRADAVRAVAPASVDVLEGVSANDFDTVLDAVGRTRPDAIVNCIGIVKQLDEAKAAVPSIGVNSLFPHRLLGLARASGARLVHVSTDCVFSGARGRYTEDDVPDPADLYGRSKLLGELTDPPA